MNLGTTSLLPHLQSVMSQLPKRAPPDLSSTPSANSLPAANTTVILQFDKELCCRFPAQNLVLHGVRFCIYVKTKWFRKTNTPFSKATAALTFCSLRQGCLESRFSVGNALDALLSTSNLYTLYNAAATDAGLECMSRFPLAEEKGFTFLQLPMPTTYTQLAMGIWTQEDVCIHDPNGALTRMVASNEIMIRLGADHVYSVPSAVRKSLQHFPIIQSFAIGGCVSTWISNTVVMDLSGMCSNTTAFFLHTSHGHAIVGIRVEADGHVLVFTRNDFISTNDGIFVMLAGGNSRVLENCFLDRMVVPFVRTDTARLTVTFSASVFRGFVFTPLLSVTALECNIAVTRDGHTSVAFLHA